MYVSVVDAVHSPNTNTLPVKGGCPGVAETGGETSGGEYVQGECPTHPAIDKYF